jgi:hypothetical protein
VNVVLVTYDRYVVGETEFDASVGSGIGIDFCLYMVTAAPLYSEEIRHSIRRFCDVGVIKGTSTVVSTGVG